MRNITTILVIVLVAVLANVNTTRAQLSKRVAGYSENHFHALRYGLYKPVTYDPKKRYPLVVYLHGSRDTVSRDMLWYRHDIQRENPAFVLTPKCENPDQGWGNTWHKGYTPATAQTLDLVDSLMTCYNIDPTRLYLYGISMGGFGTFSIVAKTNGKFAAAFAISGGSDPKAAQYLLDTPLWIFHGEADDVVPVSLSRDVYREIIRLGGKHARYTEYPGVKHNSWENALSEKSLIPWLFSQHKNNK